MRRRAISVIFVRVFAPAPRLTGIIRAFNRYHPKNGIQVSSRLRMYIGWRTSGSKPTVSQADWCFDAMITGPCGMFSSPRYSTWMLQIVRSIQFVVCVQEFATMNSARRGSTKVGIAIRMWIASDR